MQKVSEMDEDAVIIVDGKEVLIKFLKYYMEYLNIVWESVYYDGKRLLVLEN